MLYRLTSYNSWQPLPVTSDRFLHLELGYSDVCAAHPDTFTTENSAVGPQMIGGCVDSRAGLDVVGQ
jgi:hypothetical protein